MFQFSINMISKVNFLVRQEFSLGRSVTIANEAASTGRFDLVGFLLLPPPSRDEPRQNMRDNRSVPGAFTPYIYDRAPGSAGD